MRKTLLLAIGIAAIGIALLAGAVLCVLSPEPASAHAPGVEAGIGPCDGAHDTLLTTASGPGALGLPVTWDGPGLPSSSHPALPPGRFVPVTASPRTIPLRR